MKKIMKSGSKKLSKAQEGKEVKNPLKRVIKEANYKKSMFDIERMTDRLNTPNTVPRISAESVISKASKNKDIKTVRKKGGSVNSKKK